MLTDRSIFQIKKSDCPFPPSSAEPFPRASVVPSAQPPNPLAYSVKAARERPTKQKKIKTLKSPLFRPGFFCSSVLEGGVGRKALRVYPVTLRV